MSDNYLVYVADGEMPKVIHHGWDMAYKEAKRLTMKEDKQVYILRIDTIVTPRREITAQIITDIPKLYNLT